MARQRSSNSEDIRLAPSLQYSVQSNSHSIPGVVTKSNASRLTSAFRSHLTTTPQLRYFSVANRDSTCKRSLLISSFALAFRVCTTAYMRSATVPAAQKSPFPVLSRKCCVHNSSAGSHTITIQKHVVAGLTCSHTVVVCGLFTRLHRTDPACVLSNLNNLCYQIVYGGM